MSRKFENDRPGHRPDPEVTEVRTTDARLGQLRAVLDTGAVRPIACDAELAAAHATAVAGVEASGRADGVPARLSTATASASAASSTSPASRSTIAASRCAITPPTCSMPKSST